MKADSLQHSTSEPHSQGSNTLPEGQEVTLCPDCDLLVRVICLPGSAHRQVNSCPRCNRILREYHPNGLIKALSWVITGLVLFIPANIFPVLIMEILGQEQHCTIWDGVTGLYQQGLAGVAVLVFILAILVPLLRLLVLLQVLNAVLTGRHRQLAKKLFRYFLHVGEWGMVEIYLLGVLVAIIKLADMSTVHPGFGLFCFVGLMVAELGISLCLDGQTVWEQLGNEP